MPHDAEHVPWPAEDVVRYRDAGCWTGQTFGQSLAERAAAHGDRCAVRDQDRRLTYAELDTAASSLATGLRALGIAPSDRVLLHLQNSVEFVEVLFALFRLGAIPVMGLPAHRHAEMAANAAATEAVAVIVPSHGAGYDFVGLAQRVRRETPSVRHVITVGPGTAKTDAGEDLFLTPGSLPGPSAGAIALLQLSGGSTGIPKLIPRTHDDYLYSVRRSAEICRLDASAVYFAALPAAHNFTLSSPGILGTLWAGGTVALSRDPSPSAAFSFIRETGTTITGLVPPLARLWVETAERLADPDIGSLRVLQIGGARCPDELAARVTPALGATVQQVFGMAEGLVCYTRLDDEAEVLTTTQGRPMSEFDEMLVVDEFDREVPPGEPGRLLTRGPYTIRGYYRNEAANRRSFTENGWYRTGDIVRVRPDGNLSVVGRSGDFINRAGEKVSPEELEGQLRGHPSVKDLLAVGMTDPALGERTCVFVVLSEADAKPTLGELRAFGRERGLADWKLPDELRIVPDFPKTGVGKASRKALREELRG
ncbi:(2,3-dihydroxybenzoyl)adenylate synthase [Amycolatopsis alba]|uniref:2,3-dihydroxybenzoate-AMP ligase n=1 Tax=Amycolatopsis alba DSM 44262 TaxID=1125972 RepID=A0A229S2S8_AMYAL|nr:AMP-binding protein [Amycolatopsis alba]OXM53095.1 2,3-dihydroxybenzoate-AMP ligase [Amycolatopsis alba DSM 44262]